MVLLAATFGWLAWRLLVQDRQLSIQRQAEQRETAADLVVLFLDRRLTAVEQELDRIVAGESPSVIPGNSDDVLFVDVGAGQIRAWPAQSLIFYPTLPDDDGASPAVFATADELEFRQRDYRRAFEVLRPLAHAHDSRIRSGAIVRLARIHLKNGQPGESLEAYTRLADFDALPIAGMPASLTASLGRMAVFERQHDQAAVSAAAQSLHRDLNAGRWRISEATYQFVSATVRPWVTRADRPASPRLALSEAARWLWDTAASRGGQESRGRIGLDTSAGSVVVSWRRSEQRIAAFAAYSTYLERAWLSDLRTLLDARRVRLVLTNAGGHPVIGHDVPSDARAAVRLASVTGLPWTLQIVGDGGQDDGLSSRRQLLVAGLIALGALIATGTVLIGRAVTRELSVAELQSDFVSAVSHEFRTPLTTLCQLSELLTRDRVACEDDRREYYTHLRRESQRLRRLVESLLAFGRLESGQTPVRFEPVDARELIGEAVAEVAAGPHGQRHRFDLDVDRSAIVNGDRETLRCAFSNLLENAVKYSPECDTVRVTLVNRDDRVEIAVRDRGVGIPRGEQRRIFDKFVRGSAARASDVRGTGIGLALARQIVRAHGGEITVDSSLGQGSTFTVVLPNLKSEMNLKSEV